MYQPDVRSVVGVRRATQVYVVFGFGMTAYYTRVGGIGVIRHAAVMVAAGTYRLWLRRWLRRLESQSTDSIRVAAPGGVSSRFT